MYAPTFSTSASDTYRSDIDGLRAVAVLSVLIFHYSAPLPWPLLPGGFTGVDVFFVISGFLITQILASDIRGGTFSVLGFYDRRVRRILPALLVMLAVSLFVGNLLLMPGDYQSLAVSAGASALGASNFYFVNHTGYFDQASDLMPLLHTWSLAVEEQFYLVWPLLLFGIAAARARTDVAAILSAIVIAGFAASLVWFDADTKAAFYMALPRAWELALGACLVFLPQLPRALGEAATTFGLALIAAGFLLISAASFPGASALLPCIGAALVIWPRQTLTTSGRWLGTLAPIGLISYSLYLWHWPVWVFFRVYINNDQPRMREALALIVVSLALAFLSWRFVERPFRKTRWPSPRTITAGLAGCMVIFCTAMFIYSADGLPRRVPSELYAMRSMDAMWEWPCQRRDISTNLKNLCVFGAPWEASKQKAILWGDSIAEATAPLLDDAAANAGVAVAIYFRCSPVLDGEFALTSEPRMKDYNEYCRSTRHALFDQLRSSDEIQTVILMSSWGPTFLNLKSADKAETFSASILRTVDELKAMGRRVIIINNPPQWSRDPLPCSMLAAGLPRRHCGEESILQSRPYYDSFNGRFFPKLARERPDLRIIDTGAAMCGPVDCLTMLNGEHLYRDAAHLRRNLTEQTNRDLARITGLDRAFDN